MQPAVSLGPLGYHASEFCRVGSPGTVHRVRYHRQASGEILRDVAAERLVASAVEDSFHAYHALIAKGVSKETARMVLPLCTQTRLYVTGNVRSWIHYLEQRTSEGTQKEHREIAQEIGKILAEKFPTIAAAIKEAQP